MERADAGRLFKSRQPGRRRKGWLATRGASMLSALALALGLTGCWRAAGARASPIVPTRLVAAAKKEGAGPHLHDADRRADRAAADQGVPGPGSGHRRQIRPRRQHCAGGAADQRGARQPDPGRHLAPGRRGRPADRGRHRRAARSAERQGPAGDLCRPEPALGRDQPRGALARLQHQAHPAGAGAAQLRRPHRSALQGQVRLEPEFGVRRLWLHRHRAQAHGRGERRGLSARARQAADHAGADGDPRRARPRDRRRIRHGPGDERTRTRISAPAWARRSPGCRSIP